MPRPNSSLARQWGNITMPHPGNTLARCPDSTQAPQPSNTLALHRVNPAPPDPPPLRIGPTTTQHRIRFNPRSASSPQYPSTASGALPGAQKQKIGPNCNFFAIGNCCEPSDRRSKYKAAGNPSLSGRFHFARLKNEPLIAKKLQKERDFCFHNGQIATTGTRPNEKRVKSPSKGKGHTQKARRQNHTSQPD